MEEKVIKKGIVRRLFSVVLALAMVLTLMPAMSTTVYAAEAEDGWTTDSHGLMEYKAYNEIGYEVRGSVGENWYSANCWSPYYTYILGATQIGVINCDPIFINDGRQIDLVYTVKNYGSSTEQYSFNIFADTMVAGNDASKNSVNEDRSMLVMTCESGVAGNNTEKDIVFFATSSADSGAQFKGAYLLDYDIYIHDPVNYQENLDNDDSAFVVYWPQAELAPGATAEYHLIVGLTDEDSFNNIIEGGDTWNYEADGASVIATCNGECGTEGAHTATLTLTASDVNYSGSAATITLEGITAWEAAGLTAPTVAYEDANEEALESAPTAVGTYYATITVGTAKAKVQYTIEQSHDADTSKYAYDATNHWNPCLRTDCTEPTHKYNTAAHTFGTTGADRYTCSVCSYEDSDKKAAAELADAKEAAYQAIDEAAGTEPTAAVKKAADDAKAAIEACTTVADVATACQAGVVAINAAKTNVPPTGVASYTGFAAILMLMAFGAVVIASKRKKSIQ